MVLHYPAIVLCVLLHCVRTADLVSSDNWVPAENHKLYLVNDKELSWLDANRDCELKSGKLVTVDEELSKNIVAQLIKDKEHEQQYWIGLKKDIFKRWIWSKGHKLGFSNWEDGQPRSSKYTCTLMNFKGKWEVADCNVKKSSICQRHADKPEIKNRPTQPRNISSIASPRNANMVTKTKNHYSASNKTRSKTERRNITNHRTSNTVDFDDEPAHLHEPDYPTFMSSGESKSFMNGQIAIMNGVLESFRRGNDFISTTEKSLGRNTTKLSKKATVQYSIPDLVSPQSEELLESISMLKQSPTRAIFVPIATKLVMQQEKPELKVDLNQTKTTETLDARNVRGSQVISTEGEGALCVFPFIYNGVSHFDCIPSEIKVGKKWCANTNNFDRDLKWGYCETIPGNKVGLHVIDAGQNKADIIQNNSITNENATSSNHVIQDDLQDMGLLTMKAQDKITQSNATSEAEQNTKLVNESKCDECYSKNEKSSPSCMQCQNISILNNLTTTADNKTPNINSIEQTHDTSGTQTHDTSETQTHDTSETQIHDTSETQTHDASETQTHDTSGTQTHDTSETQTHDASETQIHDASETLTHKQPEKQIEVSLNESNDSLRLVNESQIHNADRAKQNHSSIHSDTSIERNDETINQDVFGNRIDSVSDTDLFRALGSQQGSTEMDQLLSEVLQRQGLSIQEQNQMIGTNDIITDNKNIKGNPEHLESIEQAENAMLDVDNKLTKVQKDSSQIMSNHNLMGKGDSGTVYRDEPVEDIITTIDQNFDKNKDRVHNNSAHALYIVFSNHTKNSTSHNEPIISGSSTTPPSSHAVNAISYLKANETLPTDHVEYDHLIPDRTTQLYKTLAIHTKEEESKMEQNPSKWHFLDIDNFKGLSKYLNRTSHMKPHLVAGLVIPIMTDIPISHHVANTSSSLQKKNPVLNQTSQLNTSSETIRLYNGSHHSLKSSIVQDTAVSTYGGNSKNEPCEFPFIYDGDSHFTCIEHGRKKAWCGTTDNYDKTPLWGYCCFEKECVKKSRTPKKIRQTKNTPAHYRSPQSIKYPSPKYSRNFKTDAHKRSSKTEVHQNKFIQSNRTRSVTRPQSIHSGVNTYGGNSAGGRCVIPFIYKGKTHKTCITRDDTSAWCATTGNFDNDLEWGNCCNKSKCKNIW